MLNVYQEWIDSLAADTAPPTLTSRVKGWIFILMVVINIL
ncbi:Uncharacterized protein YR821_2015 [Yersinia ruckeri]|uniref:Uncharacterized protein n=1 Tax=Yersinia ruckeri TaxID=29486 RepID=A0A0A8VIP4_YERRU|nr:hypothetical protein yruck0001_11280 [Yersinia ruckeri ATCC 29473]QTD76936.1 Uncharacterized protein YR821_2015 [Yersinia ruckeri]CEK27829.1 hypothetical protein CSF007_10395 [Yersinia ruckeri]